MMFNQDTVNQSDLQCFQGTVGYTYNFAFSLGIQPLILVLLAYTIRATERRESWENSTYNFVKKLTTTEFFRSLIGSIAQQSLTLVFLVQFMHLIM